MDTNNDIKNIGKLCSKCGYFGPKFHVNPAKGDGLANFCASCTNEQARLRYQQNKDRVAAQRKLSREENKATFRESNKLRARQWRKNNPEAAKLTSLRSRISKFGSRLTKAQYEEISLRDLNGPCYWCGDVVCSDDFVLDHIVPRTLLGSNEPHNLSAVHSVCNLEKSGFIPSELDFSKALRVLNRMSVLSHPDLEFFVGDFRQQRKIIACDIDSTLYPFVEAFIQEAATNFGVVVEEPVTEWSQIQDGFENTDDFLECIRLSYAEHRIDMNSPYTGCVEALHNLSLRGYEVVYFTDRPKESTQATLNWLKSYNFPNYDKVYICDDKRIELYMHREAIFTIIDDRPRTMIWALYKFGMPNIITLRHSYNWNFIDVPNVIMADTWAGIQNAVESLEVSYFNDYKPLEQNSPLQFDTPLD